MSESTVESRFYGSGRSDEDIRGAFTSGDIPVAVYGLGKMGLPLASVYAEISNNVIGADVDEDVVRRINDGDSHIKGEPGLDELVEELVQSGALRAVSNPREAATRAQVHVIIVPTPINDDNTPNLRILDSVVEDIGSGLAAGDLVVVECTVPPRTTVDRVRPKLERKSGLTLGEFGLAFCPERTSSGRALRDIRGSYPKVIGGADDESARIAEIIYSEINKNDVLTVSDATTAEAVKVFEGLYRDVNIALANELARFTDELGIDVNEAIEVANTQPFCHIHSPGPGVGGHCIPYYPYFLINGFDTDAPLLRTAREINDGMPAFTVGKLVEELTAVGKSLANSSVLILGLTYRPGVEEIRASPALPIAESLDANGAEVFAVDPVLDDTSSFPVTAVELSAVTDLDLDAVVLVTPHEEFEALDWDAFESPLVVIDGRQALDLDGSDHLVYTIGSG